MLNNQHCHHPYHFTYTHTHTLKHMTNKVTHNTYFVMYVFLHRTNFLSQKKSLVQNLYKKSSKVPKIYRILFVIFYSLFISLLFFLLASFHADLILVSKFLIYSLVTCSFSAHIPNLWQSVGWTYVTDTKGKKKTFMPTCKKMFWDLNMDQNHIYSLHIELKSEILTLSLKWHLKA